MSGTPQDFRPPEARVEELKGWPWWVWILPMLGLLTVLLLTIPYWRTASVEITITFEDGHGLKVGDLMKYRGIAVGEVRAVQLDPAADKISVSVRLEPTATYLVREQSQFWIVRPELTLANVSGLDTVVGARYLAVMPGGGEPRSKFDGAEENPSLAEKPGGLTVVMQADTASRLRRGTPISYRGGIPIGRVTLVKLSSDARWIEVRAYIEPELKVLVRKDTVFWLKDPFKLDFLGGWISGFEGDLGDVGKYLGVGLEMASPVHSAPWTENDPPFTIRSRAPEGYPADETWKSAFAIGCTCPEVSLPMAGVSTTWKTDDFGFDSESNESGHGFVWKEGTRIGLYVPARLFPRPGSKDIYVREGNPGDQDKVTVQLSAGGKMLEPFDVELKLLEQSLLADGRLARLGLDASMLPEGLKNPTLGSMEERETYCLHESDASGSRWTPVDKRGFSKTEGVWSVNKDYLANWGSYDGTLVVLGCKGPGTGRPAAEASEATVAGMIVHRDGATSIVDLGTVLKAVKGNPKP